MPREGLHGGLGPRVASCLSPLPGRHTSASEARREAGLPEGPAAPRRTLGYKRINKPKASAESQPAGTPSKPAEAFFIPPGGSPFPPAVRSLATPCSGGEERHGARPRRLLSPQRWLREPEADQRSLWGGALWEVYFLCRLGAYLSHGGGAECRGGTKGRAGKEGTSQSSVPACFREPGNDESGGASSSEQKVLGIWNSDSAPEFTILTC